MAKADVPFHRDSADGTEHLGIYLANCVVVGEAKDGRVRRIRPNARPRQMNATANNATKPTDDAQEP